MWRPASKGGLIIASKGSEISIITVAKLCNIHMKDKGRAEIRCRCPFCDGGGQKLTASINTNKGLFYCHRCGEGLNAVSLYAKVYGTSTKAAYKELLDIAI